MSQSIYPKIRFVGRKNEIEKFNKFFRNSITEKWVLFLYGPGGIGKTQLLRKFLKIINKYYASQGQKILSLSEDNMIDLYWTENRLEETLLQSLALKLAPDGFQRFFTVWQEYKSTRNSNSYDDNSINLDSLHQAFLDGYSKLDAERIVLAFDTAEQASESVLRFFRGLLKEMHEIKPETIVLIAGRPDNDTEEKIMEALPEMCEAWKIKPLGEKDIQDYLKMEGFANFEKPGVEQIANLVEGKPIRVALVIDWLREGNTLEELLENKDSKDIDHNLVQRVAYVRYPEDWLILYMALFDRRFNEEFVPILLPSEAENGREYLDRMTRFSFVKYYPPSLHQTFGNWQLHDEMRDLLKKYLWPEEDVTGEMKQHALEAIIQKYYDLKITDLEIQSDNDVSLLRIYNQERLYYYLLLDFDIGFNIYKQLTKDAERVVDRDVSYLEALNEEVKPYQKRMKDEQLMALQTNQIIAGMWLKKNAREQVLKLIEEQNWQNWDVLHQAEIRFRLAEIYNRSHMEKHLFELCYLPDRDAEQPEGEWISWFKNQLKDLSSTKKFLPVLMDFGRVLNTVGMAYRSKNHMFHAIKYFKEAIRLFESVEPTVQILAAIANVQNNLGFVYQRLGRTDEALAECQAALDIRKRFNNLAQLGFSYNVIGTIRVEQLRPEEAESSFLQALGCFERANHESGRGLVLVAYGRLLRQWGEYREISGEPSESAYEKYYSAEPMLREAVGIFRRLGRMSDLVEALNERGTLMRQMKRWEEAISYYEESLRLACNLANEYREADNECDLGIAYFRMDDLRRALKHSELAADIAKKNEAYYLRSKARQTSASVYMKQHQYQMAITAAADAATGILRLSPDRFVESAAKRTLEYERVVKWLREKVILQLPDQNEVEKAIAVLIERWETEIVESHTGKKLVDEFPGFVTAMQRAKRDYSFLKTHPEVQE